MTDKPTQTEILTGAREESCSVIFLTYKFTPSTQGELFLVSNKLLQGDLHVTERSFMFGAAERWLRILSL